jgi:dinuclear metal center YbgI/SA1388 family protein
MSTLVKLTSLLNDFLDIDNIKDYGLNGLQVQSTNLVKKVGVAVSLNQRTIDKAIQLDVDTLIVHHGLYWVKGYQPITDLFGQRVRALIENKINLLAYHLPLDIHPDIGNNEMLGKRIGIQGSSHLTIEPKGIVYTGHFNNDKDTLIHLLKNNINPSLNIYHPKDHIKTIAWCTGAGADFLNEVDEVDCFITGEISERHYDIALEKKCMLIEAGHYATEAFGIEALGAWLKEQGYDIVTIEAWSPK